MKENHPLYYEKYRDGADFMGFISSKGWTQSREIEKYSDLFFIKSAKKIVLLNRLFIAVAVFAFIILFISIYFNY